MQNLQIKTLFFFLSLCSLLQAQNKPNILFIAVDDLNDYVNCMEGSIQIPTPNIDRLAAQGTLFTNAHCQAPICGPSRASIMTGLYPSSTGNYLQLRDGNIKKANTVASQAIFMPDYFESHGYKTMAVGKIYHNGDAAQSFDEYGGRFAWFGPKPEKRFNYDPALLPHKVGNTQTDWGAYPSHDSLLTDYLSAQWATQKLQENHDQPFFLAVGFVRPHVPWYVPQKWLDQFPLESIQFPPYLASDYDDIPNMGKRVSEAPMMPTTEELQKSGQWKKALQAYMASVAFVDAQIGKVLTALENSPYHKNTIVVLWSDHGYHMGEKNRLAKQALWERATRTILIFKDVDHKKASSCQQPVQLIDIYPTLISMCDLPPLSYLEGNSLQPLLQNPKHNWPQVALAFYGEGNIAIRDQRFRLIQYEDGSQEFYDMKKDPNEWYNLAHLPKYQKKIGQLTKHIPNQWAPLSPYSTYDFNPYFIEIVKENKKKTKP